MSQTKTYTYEKNVKSGRLLKRITHAVSIEDTWTSLIGVFLAMAMPLPGIAPFGMSYLAQERKLSVKAVLIFAATSLGSIVVCDRLGSLKYISAGIIYLFLLFILEKGVKLSDVTAGVIAGVSVLAMGFAVLFFEGFSVLGLILLMCESALVVSGTLMMQKSTHVLRNYRLYSEEMDGDTKLSLAAVALVGLLGFKEVYIGSGFSVMNSIATVMLLMVSLGCGATYSTGAGILLGIVCGIGGDFFMSVLGAFGFCGFLAGAFSKFGKGGTVAGVVLANGIMAVYNNNAMETILSLWEIIAAAVIFGFVPSLWIERLKELIYLGKDEREGIAKVKEGIKARLSAASAAFLSMAKTMEHLSDKGEQRNDSDAAVIFDMTAEKVCRRCRKSVVCWGQNFNSAYEEMFEVLNVMKEKGVAKPEDIKPSFAARCINLNGFLEQLNHQFDIYRVRQVWRSRMCESRQLVSKQLGGVSEILEGLTNEIGESTKHMAVSGWEIRSKLELNGIKPRSVSVIEDKQERCRVEVVLKAAKYQGKERRIIEKVMKSCCGCTLVARDEMLENKKYVRLIFSEAQKFVVETEHASMAASEKSGDNFKFLNLKNGKFIIAISDGMGTGTRAAKESEAILELLDSFLEAGFDSRIAVRLINSIMIMKSEDEAFVTLDLCIIDLYTGEAQFIKTGAEPSFILNNSGRVRLVEAASLPVGLIAEAEAEISKTKLRDGDVVVMMTDGIENRQDGNLWVSDFVKNNDGEEGEDLAHKILNRATQNQGGTVKDDMTVLSIKLKAVS